MLIYSLLTRIKGTYLKCSCRERRVLLKRPIKIVWVRWGEEKGGRSFVRQLIWHDHITCVKHATHCSFHLGAYWLVCCIRTAFKLRHSIVSLLITKSGALLQNWLMASLVYFQKQNWLVENITIGLGLGLNIFTFLIIGSTSSRTTISFCDPLQTRPISETQSGLCKSLIRLIEMILLIINFGLHLL